MPRDLRFSIDGDSSKGIDAFKRLKAEGEATAKALSDAMASVSAMSRDLTSIASAMRGLREGAVATSRSVRSMSSNLSGIGARSREVTAALKAQAGEVNKATSALAKQRSEVQAVEKAAARVPQHFAAARTAVAGVAAQTNTMRAGLSASSAVLSRMVTQAAVLANRLAYGARAASIQMRSGFAGAAQGLQGLGIGFRMSGIAVGNQLANLGGQGFAGLLGGAVGAAAAGAEMAVRLVSSFSGTAVRLLGAAANAILVPVGSLIEGVGKVIGTTLSAALGGAVSFVAQAAGNILSGVTNLVGEAISQVGNIFTGLMEAARGAFQGVVSIASNLLGGLVNVAETVVGKIGGVLGTIGKTALGVAGTLGGFAIHDFAQTESGLTKGIVLLDDKLSPQDKRNLRSWAEDLHRQMPTITRSALGDTFQRVVSTGFSGDLEGAKKATAAALRLQFATEGGGDPAEAARVIAKSFSIFRDELEKFPDPLQRISDLLFQTVNAADVTLGDLTSHLGMVLGPAKALGMSLEDLLVMIAKMSRSADVEQTFTGLRRLLLEPLKMGDAAQDILKKHGLSVTALSPEEESAVKAKQKAIADKEAEIAALEAGKSRAPEQEAARKKAQRAAIAEAEARVAAARSPWAKAKAREEAAALKAQFAREDAASAAAGTPKADVRDRIKALKDEVKEAKKELAEFSKTAGSVTNLTKFLDDLAKAGLSARELAVVFPDIRALVAAMTRAQQDPKMAAKIEAMIRSGAAGKTGEAVAEQAQTLQVKLLQLWEGLKAPFRATLDSLESPFKGFLDRMIGGLASLTKWWEKALVHPAAGRFLDNISAKFGGVFKSLLGGLDLKAPTGGQFWRFLSDGLNKAWEFGTKVVNVFKTLGGLIADLAAGSKTLQGVWSGMKSGWDWVKGTFDQLSKGKTDNLKGVWDGAKGALDTVWNAAKNALEPIVQKARSIFDAVVSTASAVWEGMKSAFSTIVTGLKAILPALAAFAALPLLRRLGGALAMPTPQPWGGGAGGARGLAGAGGGGGGAAGAAAMAAPWMLGPGGLGGPGRLSRKPVYTPSYAMLPQRPTVTIKYSNAERKRLGIPYTQEYVPFTGPLAPPVYGGFRQTGTQLVHTPDPLGRYVGRPDLMGPENDALFAGKGRLRLTAAEGAAMFLRPDFREKNGLPMTQEEANAYFNSPAFAASREGWGPVPMSPAANAAQTWSMKDRMRVWGGRAWRGTKALGARAGRAIMSPGGLLLGSMALDVGNAMVQESGASETTKGLVGTASSTLSGAATGAMIGSVVPVIGTAVGAVAGALIGLGKGIWDWVSNAKAAAAAIKEADLGAALKKVQDDLNGFGQAISGLSPEEQRAALEKKAAKIEGDESLPEEARKAGAAGARKAATDLWTGTLQSAFKRGRELMAGGEAGSPEMKAVMDRLNAATPKERGDAAEGMGFDRTAIKSAMMGWQIEMDKAVSEAAEAEAKAAKEAQALADTVSKFKDTASTMEQEIAAVEEEMAKYQDGGWSQGFGSADQAARYFEGEAGLLEDWAAGAADSLKDVPPGAEEAAQALQEMAQAARDVAGMARDAQAHAAGLAAEGAAKTPEQLMEEIPVLKALFKGTVQGATQETAPAEPSPVDAAAQDTADALEGTTNAAEDTADAVEQMGTAVNDAAAAVQTAAGQMRVAGSGLAAMTIPTTNSPFPANEPMTAGEARQRRKQMRHEAHLARLRSAERHDQFGNTINPMTGMPSVGDFGGIGWQFHGGGGDMGSHGAYGGGKKKDPYGKSQKTADGGIVLADGSVYYPFANGKDGPEAAPWQTEANPWAAPGAGAKPSPTGKGGGVDAAADAAKATADKAGEAADAAKDLKKGIDDTGKAMKDTANAAKQATSTAGKAVDVVKQKVGELHEADVTLNSKIEDLRSQVTSLSATSAGD